MGTDQADIFPLTARLGCSPAIRIEVNMAALKNVDYLSLVEMLNCALRTVQLALTGSSVPTQSPAV